MKPKRLTCMDEDLTIEITGLKDKDSDLIITVSITRTFLFTDSLETISPNEAQKLPHQDIHAYHSVAI